MKIGILSDTHNLTNNIRAALAVFEREGVRRLFHCGDITAEETLGLFVGWDITFVWGNMDLAQGSLQAAARQLDLRPPVPLVRVTLDGASITALHGHERLMSIINSPLPDGIVRGYVLHGHTHQRRDERLGPIRVINPGALGGTRRESRSLAILDVAADDLRFFEIEG
jgi:putative phosphoesterase